MTPVSVWAGRLSYFSDRWESITSDTRVLDWIKGFEIPFKKQVTQILAPREPQWSPLEKFQISKQIGRLLKKGAITKCVPKKGEFISQIFLTPKPDGSNCFILNLKNLNEYIETEHFKLEDLRTARDLLDQGSFMVTLDLKDAYYAVPIAESSKKYLRFLLNEFSNFHVCRSACIWHHTFLRRS